MYKKDTPLEIRIKKILKIITEKMLQNWDFPSENYIVNMISAIFFFSKLFVMLWLVSFSVSDL